MIVENLVKMASQLKERKGMPLSLNTLPEQERMSLEYYVTKRVVSECAIQPRGRTRTDPLRIVWMIRSIARIIDSLLKEQTLDRCYFLDIDSYHNEFVVRIYENELTRTRESFHVGDHFLGLLERSWGRRDSSISVWSL